MTELVGIYNNYTLAQIATLLGMNFNSTDNILYMGSASTTGIKINSYTSTGTNGYLVVNGSTVQQSGFSAGKNLKYQAIEGGGFTLSFSTNKGVLDLIVAKYKNTIDDTEGWCYLICNSNYQTIIFDDMTDKVAVFTTAHVYVQYPQWRTPVTNTSITGGSATINAISIAPLVVQNTNTNVRLIKGVYMPIAFPPDTSGYTEFTLSGDNYISLCENATSTIGYGRFIVKEAS